MQNTNNNNGTAGNGGTSFLDSLISMPNYFQLTGTNNAMGTITNHQVVPEAGVGNPDDDQTVPTNIVYGDRNVPTRQSDKSNINYETKDDNNRGGPQRF